MEAPSAEPDGGAELAPQLSASSVSFLLAPTAVVVLLSTVAGRASSAISTRASGPLSAGRVADRRGASTARY